MALFVWVCFPLLMICCIIYRQNLTRRAFSSEDMAKAAVTQQVGRTVMNYRLIADYNRRPFYVDRLDQKSTLLSYATIHKSQVLRTNEYLAPWITCILASSYIIFGGAQVLLDGGDGFGIFFVNLLLTYEIGGAWGATYKMLIDLQAVSPALELIKTALNLSTDVPHRMQLNRERRKMTRQKKDEFRKNMHSEGLTLDNLPVIVHDVEFKYNGGVLRIHGDMRVTQGRIVLIVGPKGEGKSTILKLIGSVILPKPVPGFYVPSHLRVLHVSEEPLFIMGTLYDNLVFGTNEGDPDREKARVYRICSELSLPDQFLAELKPDTKPLQWGWADLMSNTQRRLFTLARAMVANPELVCLHKPTMAFDSDTSRAVLEMLQNFVRNKGIGQNAQTRHLRRPRTCMMTTSKVTDLPYADDVYFMTHDRGIRRVLDRGLVTDSVLKPDWFK